MEASTLLLFVTPWESWIRWSGSVTLLISFHRTLSAGNDAHVINHWLSDAQLLHDLESLIRSCNGLWSVKTRPVFLGFSQVVSVFDLHHFRLFSHMKLRFNRILYKTVSNFNHYPTHLLPRAEVVAGHTANYCMFEYILKTIWS